MLSVRQFKILYFLHTSCLEAAPPQTIFSVDDLAEMYQVTSRTIRSDIAAIAEYALGHGIEVSIARGSVAAAVTDQGAARAFMDQAIADAEAGYRFVDENARAKYIIEALLMAERPYIRLDQLAGDLFISQSRLSQDLKRVRTILADYNLELEQIKGTGARIVGDTLDKRRCLIMEATVSVADGLEYVQNNKYRNMIDMAGEIVTTVLLKYDFSVSDVTLQNIVVHVAATVEMLHRKSTIDDDYPLDGEYDSEEHAIAEEILKRFQRRIGISYTPKEVELLAISIRGKREYEQNSYVTDEINDLVVAGLREVEAVYELNLTGDLDLRISLALHLSALIARLERGAQESNPFRLYFKQRYAFAFQVATTFVGEILPRYASTITDDELSYLAAYFVTMDTKRAGLGSGKRAIIITRDKRSNTILMRKQLMTSFPALTQVDIAHGYMYRELELHEYDCVLVTERSLTHLSSNCILIDHASLTENETYRIALALDGFDVERDLVAKFDRRIFVRGSAARTEDALDVLFERVLDAGLADEHFKEMALRHTAETNPYFGNQLAIIHPDQTCESCTRSFIGVFISDQAFRMHGFDVNMVLLLGISTKDESRFQIWNYISLLISSGVYVDALRGCTDVTAFVACVRSIFKLELGA